MTDEHSELADDDAAVTPPQPPKADWPKKIRTLTAAELDRLTIDSTGRFYWDGQLVNYQPPVATQAPASDPEPLDLDAMALLDRAARELSGQPSLDAPGDAPAHTTSAISPQSVEIHQSDASAFATTAVATVPGVSSVAPMTIVDMPRRGLGENVRVRMSFLQSLALLLMVLGLLVGAIGIAVSGLVVAHDWGCRVNLVKQYCPPPPPAPKPPARVDIPA